MTPRSARLGQQHELRETITAPGDLDNAANLSWAPTLDSRPPSPPLRDRIQSHHEMGGWLGAGEERSHERERETIDGLRTLAAAPATVAA